MRKILNLYNWGCYNEEKITVVYKQAKVGAMPYAVEVRCELYLKNAPYY